MMKKLYFLKQNSVIFLMAIICSLFISFVVINKIQVENITMERLILAKNARVNDVLSRLVHYRANVISSLVLKSENLAQDLENVANTITEDPSVMRIAISPGGIVEYVYPLEGNESVLGTEPMINGVGVQDAIKARELGETVLGGPYEGIGEGGQVLITRTPVYNFGEDGTGEFWGLISIIFSYSRVMELIGLEELQLHGYAYTIYNINPNTGEKQLIGKSDCDFDENSRFIEEKVTIMNADWVFRIYSTKKWYMDTDLWLLIMGSICLSFFVSRIQQISIKAEEASKAKSNFLASMSHEIRTPMNAIIGISELLMQEPLDERQMDYVYDIKVSSTALLGIINDILDVSKIEAGKLTFTPVNFDLPELIKNTYSVISFAAEDKNLRFIVDISPEIPKFVYGDDVRLRQILINLLGNAVKFTDKGHVKLAVEHSEGTVNFIISDTGIGIKKSNIERLYDSFEQFDLKKNRGKQGTGLGLSITKSLINMMDGTIQVDSIYGEGTTFTVKIPLPPGDENQTVKAGNMSQIVSAKDANILLVDDNEINRKVASGLLRLNDIVCDTAENGIEAIQKVRGKNYDIVFMDHMMPEMDGMEATAEIRKLGGKYKQGQLVIIALTANVLQEARDLFVESGADDFLPKPIDKALLNNMLVKWLPKEKQNKKTQNKLLFEEIRKSDYSPVLKAACAVEGLDVPTGLKRVSSIEDYERSLRLLSSSIPKARAELERFLADGEVERFAIDVHGIKGALSINGHIGLSEMAQKLETESKNGNLEFCRNYFPVFSEQMKLFSERLGQIFNEVEVKQKNQGSIDILIEALEKVEDYVAQYNRESALKELNEISGYTFGGSADRALEQLIEALEDFNFDRAAELIQGIEL